MERGSIKVGGFIRCSVRDLRGNTTPSKIVVVMVGGSSFSLQLWWELASFLETRLQKKNGLLCCGEDDGFSRAEGRVNIGRRMT